MIMTKQGRSNPKKQLEDKMCFLVENSLVLLNFP